jgi:hypothetical protein
MRYTKICYCLFILLSIAGGLAAQNKNAFNISGNIGLSTNFYTSNEPNYGTVTDSAYRRPTRPSYAWNLYGNFIAKTGEFTIPVSFVVNQYDKSNRPANTFIGFSPTYRRVKLHFGDRNIPFSPLTFYGQSFRGVGIEYYPKVFRFAAFYGSLNRAANEDITGGEFRPAKYSRKGYGAKIGIGSPSTFIDFIYFHAKDDSTSATFKKDTIAAQENSVFGTAFKLTVLKKLILSGDVAIVALTPDLSYPEDTTKTEVRKLISKVVNYNVSTIASYAGQSSLIFLSRSFTSNLQYRRVQQDFKSFGTPYMVHDVENISWQNNLTLAKGRLNVSTNLSRQHNNIEKNQFSELKTQVGTFNINAILSQHFSLNGNFSGYNLKQKDGTGVVDESIRLDQAISQYNFGPSYTISKGTKIHLISANVSVSVLKDRNHITSPHTNSNNFSGSANYAVAFVNKPYNASITFLYSKYTQGSAVSYNSYGGTIGTSAQLLKNKNLNLNGNVGYFSNRLNAQTSQKNITYSLNVGYRANKHNFNLFANYVYTPSNLISESINKAINSTVPYAVASKYLAGGLTYNYTF